MRTTFVVFCACMGFVYAILAAPTQCVRLNPATVCSTGDNCYNTSDCTVGCDGVSVNVVGRCVATWGNPDVTVADNISTSANADSNIYCWCAMTTPFASRWVMRYQYSNAAQCGKNCGRGCRNAMIFNGDTDIEFRKLLYSNPI